MKLWLVWLRVFFLLLTLITLNLATFKIVVVGTSFGYMMLAKFLALYNEYELIIVSLMLYLVSSIIELIVKRRFGQN